MAKANANYTDLSGFYKRGSTWDLLLRRKNPDGRRRFWHDRAMIGL